MTVNVAGLLPAARTLYGTNLTRVGGVDATVPMDNFYVIFRGGLGRHRHPDRRRSDGHPALPGRLPGPVGRRHPDPQFRGIEDRRQHNRQGRPDLCAAQQRDAVAHQPAGGRPVHDQLPRRNHARVQRQHSDPGPDRGRAERPADDRRHGRRPRWASCASAADRTSSALPPPLTISASRGPWPDRTCRTSCATCPRPSPRSRAADWARWRASTAP